MDASVSSGNQAVVTEPPPGTLLSLEPPDVEVADGQAAAATPSKAFGAVRSAVHRRLIAELGDRARQMSPYSIVQRASEVLDAYLNVTSVVISREDRDRLFSVLIADVLGYGPLDPLLADGSISDIVVNGPEKVYVDRDGRLQRVDTHFEDEDHLRDVIQRMVVGVGRRVDENSPICDARLPDGSRVNVVLPPVSVKGPALTIRKMRQKRLEVHDLVTNGTLTEPMVQFLKACVSARMNILVAGGGTSGKTTTLNVLSGFIPRNERIVTVEDVAELRLRQRHVIRLEARPANVEGQGIVSIRQLVVNTLRMRPDRIIVGEVRSGEALDMLQAMNTGHDGSLTTVHANSTRDSLARLETLVLMAGAALPSRAIREQIASAINIVVMQDKLRDGSRKVTAISEVVGLDDTTILLEDLFLYRLVGIEAGRVVGRHEPTGVIPRCLEALTAAGQAVSLDWFDAEGPLGP
jgi:pilus assembly protein CpaF